MGSQLRINNVAEQGAGRQLGDRLVSHLAYLRLVTSTSYTTDPLTQQTDRQTDRQCVCNDTINTRRAIVPNRDDTALRAPSLLFSDLVIE
ncbi:hypothetical protein J6590_016497 [Homalodisca vitripennis]|nr:hypothetical protein J6590_016497 [Homalodisca vitripennis]